MAPRERLWYLLLNFGVPSFSSPYRASRHLALVRRELKSVGVSVAVREVRRLQRYFFRFPRYSRDDAHAFLLADSFHFVFAVLWGRLFEPNREAAAIPVPAQLVETRRPIEPEELTSALIDQFGGYEPSSGATNIVFRATTTTPDYFEGAWRMSPVVYSHPHLFDASRFLKTSYDHFYVDPVDIAALAANPEVTATSSSHQSFLEDALQNAFKSVEAIVGDPPVSDSKFSLKIRRAGSDPNQLVGYTDKRTLLQAIREMNTARDKRAAHGSTRKRTIRLLELADFQACAHELLLSAVEHRAGKPIWPI